MKTISVTCKNEDCNHKFRVPEFKFNSTVRNNPDNQECLICKNKKLLAKSTLYDKGNSKKTNIGFRTYQSANKTKTTKKRSKIPNKNKLKKQLDTYWSKLIKINAGYKCEVCGKTKALNSHHIYSRAKQSTRWDISNGLCLCVGCHIGVDFSAHKTPIPFARWLTKYKKEKFLDMLEIKANSSINFHEFELEMILKGLKEAIKIANE